MAELGRNLWRSYDSTPLKKGLLEQVAQDHIRSLKREIHNFSGQSVPVGALSPTQHGSAS